MQTLITKVLIYASSDVSTMENLHIDFYADNYQCTSILFSCVDLWTIGSAEVSL